MSYIVTFHSVSDALMAKRMLDACGGVGVVIPAPRALSSSCGYALEVEGASNLALKEVLSDFDEFSEIYCAERSGKNVIYTELQGVQGL